MKSSSSGEVMNQVIDVVSRILNYISLVSLLGMMAVTVLDVLLRFFIEKPVIGSTEMTTSFMICMTAGMAYSALKGGSIKMDLIIERLPKKVQLAFDSVTTTLGLVIVLFVTISIAREVSVIKDLMMETPQLRIPEYPFYFLMAVSFGLLVIVMAKLIVENIKAMVKDER